jgi:hypothetical protein
MNTNTHFRIETTYRKLSGMQVSADAKFLYLLLTSSAITTDDSTMVSSSSRFVEIPVSYDKLSILTSMDSNRITNAVEELVSNGYIDNAPTPCYKINK